MICRNCATDCKDGTLYCVNCGAPLQSAPVYRAVQPGHGLAIASLISGIASFLPILPVISSVLAICLGIIARANGNREGISTAGIVCGIVSLVLTVLMIVLVIVFVSEIFEFAGPYGEFGGFTDFEFPAQYY